MSSLLLRNLSVGLFVVQATTAELFADSLPTGGRATMLGGAYTAISDDAAAVAYNPAGLAFAKPGSQSITFNAYYERKFRIAESLLGQSQEQSAIGMPWFTGTMLARPRWAPRFSFAVAIFDDAYSSRTNHLFKGKQAIDGGELEMTTRYKSKSDEGRPALGVASAFALSRSTAVGLSFGLFQAQYSSLETQDSRIGPWIYSGESGSYNIYVDQLTTTETNTTEQGGFATIGIRHDVVKNWSLGASVRALRIYRASKEKRTSVYMASADADGKPILVNAGDYDMPITSSERQPETVENDIERRQYPVDARLGSAISFGSGGSHKWALDLIYVGRGMEEGQATFPKWDVATGLELSFRPIFLRAGAMTAYDPTQRQLRSGLQRNGQFMDYYISTLSAGYTFDTWSLAVGGILTRGIGRVEIEEAEANRTSRAEFVGRAVCVSIQSAH